MIKTSIINRELRDALIFCCYTGLHWCDVEALHWGQIKGGKLVTTISQKKIGKPVELTLHPIAKKILESRKGTTVSETGKKRNHVNRIFWLPIQDGANKSLGKWAHLAGINKHITWHSARLSFAILLQDANVDTPTVALLLGRTIARHVNETYKRHRPKNQAEHIAKLPAAEWNYN